MQAAKSLLLLGFTKLFNIFISVASDVEREKSDKFCSETLISARGSFTCRKSTIRNQRLYFPSEGSHTQDFYALKKSIDLGRVWTREPRIQWQILQEGNHVPKCMAWAKFFLARTRAHTHILAEQIYCKIADEDGDDWKYTELKIPWTLYRRRQTRSLKDAFLAIGSSIYHCLLFTNWSTKKKKYQYATTQRL